MIITQTPLRISFVGGGTDFRDFYLKEEGEVISTAIDKYIYVILKERFDKKIYINYSKKEIVDHVDEIQHELVREAMRKTGVTEGVEITTLADIPSTGSGLGSSSSVTVGLLNALYAYQGEFKSAETLAAEACEIEIDILGKPIGKQDQYIAAYGNIRHIQFRSDERVDIERIAISEDVHRKLNSNLLLFYTGMRRQASDILTEQKAKIYDTTEILSEMKYLVAEMKDVLLYGTNSTINLVGKILNKGWQMKKQLASKITNTAINDMYETALKAGAIGGKITGAGGGGFLLLYVPPDRQDDVRETLRHLQEFPFVLDRNGSKIIFNIQH